MKLSPMTSRQVSVCLCSLLTYVLLVLNIAPFSVRPVYAEANKRKLSESVTDPLQRSRAPRLANSETSISFIQGTNNPPARAGEVLVKFRATASEQDKDVVALTYNSQRKKLKGESGAERLQTTAGQSAETLALALLQNPAIEFAEPNFLVKPDQTNSGSTAGPDDTQFSEQWALKNTGQNGGQYGPDMGVTAAWQTTTGTVCFR